MTAQEIRKVLTNTLKNKQFIIWTIVRLISAIGPLLATYVFSRGIDALEVHESLANVAKIFLLLFAIWATENVVRIFSKSRLAIFTELAIIEIQEILVEKIDKGVSNRKEIVQSIRNLTQAIRNFSIQFRDSAVNALVSFVTVPIILYFIDKRIFALELVVMGLYLVINMLFSRLYEKRYELFDKSREYYYGKIQDSNEVEEEAEYVRKRVNQVQNIFFGQWTTLQTIVALSQFLVLYLVSGDILSGTRHISSLVLIFGYTTTTGLFLNGITGILERFMETEAGIERLVVVSNKDKPVNSIVG